jgi:hypothetical protein
MSLKNAMIMLNWYKATTRKPLTCFKESRPFKEFKMNMSKGGSQ